MATETGHPWWTSFVASVLGRILLHVGAIDRATDVLAAGLEVADRDGTQLYVLRCLGPLAEATALRGDSVRARAIAERVESLIPPTGHGPLFLHAADGPIGAGRAWLAIGDVARAVAVLRQVADAANAAGWIEPRAAAALALGLAHDAAGAGLDARAELERAVEIAGEYLPGITADASAVLARHVRASGDPDAADRLATRARDLYAMLASTLSPGENRTRYELLVASRLDDAGDPLVVR
jgi:tetratricopeptide (TPR) repeat protein